MEPITKRFYLSIVILLCALPVRSAGDTNEDGLVSLSDLTCLINWLLNPDETCGHQYVDLRLPSGTLWATQNIGANASYEPGILVAWGETQDKSNYTWQSYQWTLPDTTLTRYIQKRSPLWTIDDAASIQWGGLWRTPTASQWQELMEYCNWHWTSINGQYGYRVSSYGVSIFLPAAGYMRDSNYYENNLSGFYWARESSSSNTLMAYGLYIDESDFVWGNRHRHTGRSIRPALQPSDLLHRFDVNADGQVNQADVHTLIGILLSLQ